jgi:alpha-L-fucosidase
VSVPFPTAQVPLATALVSPPTAQVPLATVSVPLPTVQVPSPTVQVPPAVVPLLPGRFVQVSLLQELNNKGIGSAPGQGNFDGSGFAYPANQLPPAGLRILNGVPYQFPSSAPRASDNVAALGQTIALPQGNYQQAFLLVSTSWGSISDKIIVHYTDGSTSLGLFNSPDWRIGQPGIVNASYRYSSTGTEGPVHIYAIQIAIDRTKRVSSLTLPMTAQPRPNIPCLHVFALTLQYAA